MLVLTRKAGEEIIVGDNITLTVVGMSRNRVRIAIDAPHSVPILRAELAFDRNDLLKNLPVRPTALP